MIRTILFAAILLSAVALKAQSPLSFGAMNGMSPAFRHFGQLADSNGVKKKWFITKYAGISSGFMAFRGGSGSFLSAPVGIQLNRQLTNNVYAFAGVSVAPTFFYFNSPFSQPANNKYNGFMNANNVGVYSAAHMGLMYTNDERTFSISGSISVGRYSGNGYAPYYNPANTPVLRSANTRY
jgi:hypothetical protein